MHQTIATIFAQAAAPAQQAQPGGPMSGIGLILSFVCFGVIFYFMLIRPQRLKQKEMDKLLAAVKTGDAVITTSGIHGRVGSVKEKTIILKIADNVKIEMEKSAIASVSKSAPADTAA